MTTWNKKDPFHWSEYSLWKRSKRDWYKQYGIGAGRGSGPESPELRFGKEFAEELEKGINRFGIVLPEHPEYHIATKIKKQAIAGTLDGWSPSRRLLTEFKTGAQPWTQTRVDKHGQLDWYAYMLYMSEALSPNMLHIELTWFPTEKYNIRQVVKHLPNGEPYISTDYDIRFKEGVKPMPFQTRRSLQQVLVFMDDVLKTRDAMEQYIRDNKPRAVDRGSAEKKTNNI